MTIDCRMVNASGSVALAAVIHLTATAADPPTAERVLVIDQGD